MSQIFLTFPLFNNIALQMPAWLIPRGLSESRLSRPCPEKWIAYNRIQKQCFATNCSDIFLSHLFAFSQNKIKHTRTSRHQAALKSLWLAGHRRPFRWPATAQSSPGRPGGVRVPSSSARLPTQRGPLDSPRPRPAHPAIHPVPPAPGLLGPPENAAVGL